MKTHLFAFAVTTLALALPARAETPDEMAFGFGQFVGAASYCKISRAQINEVAAALLAAQDIDSSKPGPEMTRFTAGVTEGVKAMSAPDAASCDEVKVAFQDAYKKIH